MKGLKCTMKATLAMMLTVQLRLTNRIVECFILNSKINTFLIYFFVNHKKLHTRRVYTARIYTLSTLLFLN